MQRKLWITCGFWTSLSFLTPQQCGNLVFRYMNSHEWLIKARLLFTARFQEQFATVPVSAVRRPWAPQERGLLSSYCPFPWGGGMRPGAQTPGRVTQRHTRNGRERARVEKILVWAQITSRFTSWMKANALEAYSIYNARIVQTSTQSRGPPRNREQFNELCTEFTRKFT